MSMSMASDDQDVALGHRVADEGAAVSAEGRAVPHKHIVCTFCNEGFATRSALFRHLRRPDDSCPAPREDFGEKIMLVIGYDCVPSGKEDGGVSGGDTAASCVMQAMGLSVQEPSRPPAGFSQASCIGSKRSPLLAQESGVSASADNICLRAPCTVPLEGTRAWLDVTNTALEGTGVRVLGRMALKHPEFHAEKNATFRRYEYVLPVWILDGASAVPWAASHSSSSLIPFLQRLRQLGLKPFGHCNGGPMGRRRRCPLWHNFSADALPHSSSSGRRLYRYYACETLEVRGANYVCLSVSGDAFMNQQVRGMVGLSVAATRGLISAEDIFACIDPAKQEDLLPVPLAPVAPCSLAEVGYSTWQSKLGGVRLSPGTKRGSHPLLEGWSTTTERSFAADFRRRLLENAARWWDDRRQGQDWLRDVLEPGAVRLRVEIDSSNERARKETAIHSEDNSPSPWQDIVVVPPPAEFVEVLRLLREADSSGRWPGSTAARSIVISGGNYGASQGGEPLSERPEDDAENSDVDTVSTAQDPGQPAFGSQESEQSQERPPWRSGSFTIGAFPPPCPPPRGNRLFPELARAAFELETVLLPRRPPSTTIAVNRHARFKPHVDSGAGAGQSLSLIVGLGNYSGGELVIEGEEKDIQYRPLEFDGWTQRHWTRPFQGERYSLVWFTPKGCEGVSGDARFCTPGDD